MSNSSTSFDPKQAVSELIGFVRNRASELGSKTLVQKPNSDRMRAAVLSAISGDSLNAREVGRAIETASAGVLKPSDGEIQVELAELVDAGFATAKNKSDRKTYQISKLGETELKRLVEQINAQTPEKQTGENTGWLSGMNLLNCDTSFMTSASKLGPVLLDLAQTGTKEQQASAVKVLEKARHELHLILAEK